MINTNAFGSKTQLKNRSINEMIVMTKMLPKRIVKLYPIATQLKFL